MSKLFLKKLHMEDSPVAPIKGIELFHAQNRKLQLVCCADGNKNYP